MGLTTSKRNPISRNFSLLHLIGLTYHIHQSTTTMKCILLFSGMILTCTFGSIPLFSQVQANQIGIFDNHLDIGSVKHKGFVNYDPVAQHYLLGGSGTNMWFGEDQMHYVWKSVQGDFILRAEFAFIGEGVDPHRKMGWAVRKQF